MTVAPIDKAHIINQSLLKLGQPASYRLDDNNKRASIIDLQWSHMLDRAFGMHSWTWARRPNQLNKLSDVPLRGFEYTFQLPIGQIGPSVQFYHECNNYHERDVIRNFEIVGSKLHTNYQQVFAVDRVLIDPLLWEVNFRVAFTVGLSSILAVPLIERQDLEAKHGSEAFGTPQERGKGGLFGLAISQDRASQPVGFMNAPDPLTSAHYGSGRYNGGHYRGRGSRY